jgi:hypothetical protein
MSSGPGHIPHGESRPSQSHRVLQPLHSRDIQQQQQQQRKNQHDTPNPGNVVSSLPDPVSITSSSHARTPS